MSKRVLRWLIGGALALAVAASLAVGGRPTSVYGADPTPRQRRWGRIAIPAEAVAAAAAAASYAPPKGDGGYHPSCPQPEPAADRFA
jgi:hypothetical protein